MRASAGITLTSDSVSALCSRLAERNWRLTSLNSELSLWRGEILDEGPVLLESLLQVIQRLFGQKQQRFAPHHFQVALIEHITKKVGLRLDLFPKPFHKLPVFLHVLALDDRYKVVLSRKLLSEAKKILVVLFVRPD
jgi:hypothetical protein